MIYNFFDNKSSSGNASGGAVKSQIMLNQQLEEEIIKPIKKKREKYKVYSSFKDNICGCDLANMQLLRKYNKRTRFFYYVPFRVLGNMQGLFLLKKKMVLKLLILLKKVSSNTNQTKNGIIKVVNFT